MSETRVVFERDEWWPVFSINRNWKWSGVTADLPTEFVERVEAITKEFGEIQDELAEMFEAARARRKATA